MSRSEGDTVVAANVGGQSTLLKKPFKDSKSEVFAGGRKRLAAQQVTTGVIGDGERIAVVTVAEQELAFVIGAPEVIGTLTCGQLGALGATPRPTPHC